jgi:hypothetical protein
MLLKIALPGEHHGGGAPVILGVVAPAGSPPFDPGGEEIIGSVSSHALTIDAVPGKKHRAGGQ